MQKVGVFIPKLKDLTNQKFGRWTVKYRAEDRFGKNGKRRVFWHCECKCGNEKDVPANALLSGSSKSCGCLHSDIISNQTKKMHLKNRTTYDLSGDFGIGYTYDGYFFYFDLEDYTKIKDFNWFKNDQDYFLARVTISDVKSSFKYIRLHRLIMNVDNENIKIDHIHGKNSRYDNRKSNLRYATHSQNNQNKGNQKNNTSGIRGIDYSKIVEKWRARITKEGITYTLGYFDNIEDAIKARIEAEDKYFKEWSYKNSMNMEVK